MKAANNYSHKTDQSLLNNLEDRAVSGAHVYNKRPCASCGNTIFGMPGGYDALCSVCGHKDPCCSD